MKAKKEFKNIFVVKNRAMGDAVIGLSALQYLRDLYPKANIIYALPKWICPLFEDVQTAANEIYPLELNAPKDFAKLSLDLFLKKVDCIYEMHQSGRTGKFFTAQSVLTRIPYHFHNHHKKKGKVRDQGIIKEVIQRDLDGVYSAFSSGDIPNYLDYQPIMMPKSNVDKLSQIVFGVVATRETKMWKIENYITLAKLIYDSYPDVQIKIPLSKSMDDIKIKNKMQAIGLSPNVDIVHLPLNEIPRLMLQSQFYIGNDTGLKHIAISCGIKSYTFFGPEQPSEWHPYDKEKHPIFFVEDLSCRTLNAHYCALDSCEKMDCLNPFDPWRVFTTISTDLNLTSRETPGLRS